MLYTSPVNLTGAVSQNGSLASLSIKLVNQQHGHFYLLFPPQTDGIFSIILTVRGTLKNVGDFETSATYTIHVVAKRAVFPLEISAWGEVLAALLVVLYLFRLCTTPLPFGAWSRSDRPGEHQFRLRWRRFWKLFFHRNRLLSKQAMMPTGLEFRFRRGRIWPRPSLWERRIQVRARGDNGNRWFTGDDKLVPKRFSEPDKLVYRPGLGGNSTVFNAIEYTLIPKP